MKVNHGGFDRRVAKEVLDGPDVSAALEQMGGEAVAQGVACGPFGDISPTDGFCELPLHGIFVEVMTRDFSCSRVGANIGSGEDVLPDPLRGRPRVLALETLIEMGFPESDSEVLSVPRRESPLEKLSD